MVKVIILFRCRKKHKAVKEEHIRELAASVSKDEKARNKVDYRTSSEIQRDKIKEERVGFCNFLIACNICYLFDEYC